MLQSVFQLPKNRKMFYDHSNNLDYSIVGRKIKVTPSYLFDRETLAELKDKQLLSTIKKARLEYKSGALTSEEEITELLSS